MILRARFSSLGSLALALMLPAVAAAEEAERLQESFATGSEYHVSTRVELSGSLSLPLEKGQTTPKTLPVTGSSAIDYDEKVLTTNADGGV